MALVTYENSESSEYEDEDSESGQFSKLDELRSVTLTAKGTQHDIKTVDSVSEGSKDLFNRLPQPTKIKASFVEEDDEFLQKKSINIKPKAKITVPSLSEFKDVSDKASSTKPRMHNGNKSSLLSLLPKPKNAVTVTSKSLMPNILTQKQSNLNNVKKKKPMPSLANQEKTLSIGYSDESDDDDGEVNDFFSIHKPVDITPVEDLPLDIDMNNTLTIVNVKSTTDINLKQPRNIQSYFKKDDNLNQGVFRTEQETNGEYSIHNEGSAVGSVDDGLPLDEEAIRKLCGARGKRKREDIQIVDVNQQEVLADAREWLLKGLMDDTSKRISCSKKRGNEPTNQQKKKHQITYLAHQAKANEAELQNQWANNRMTKRQTQSKYGF